MTTCSASLMSVPVKNTRGSILGNPTNSPNDYGLLLNRHELARYDGCIDELPILVAYRGRIYDATDRKLDYDDDSWRRYAGRDCTADLLAHPRRNAWLMSLPCVGALED